MVLRNLCIIYTMALNTDFNCLGSKHNDHKMLMAVVTVNCLPVYNIIARIASHGNYVKQGPLT